MSHSVDTLVYVNLMRVNVCECMRACVCMLSEGARRPACLCVCVGDVNTHSSNRVGTVCTHKKVYVGSVGVSVCVCLSVCVLYLIVCTVCAHTVHNRV